MENTPTIRKRFTAAEGEQLAKLFQASGLTQREFAQQQNIHSWRLRYWLRRTARQPSARAAAFIPVPNLLAAAPLASAYRLHWPGGLALEVRAGFAPSELATLLGLLPAL
jgi:hypothetical protein